MNDLRIRLERLEARLEELAQIGALPGGGVSRLALTEADKAARDRVVRWMEDLQLTVSIDRIGNVVGTRRGRIDGPGLIMGSHIDTVATGGIYDGNLGVLAGLEVIETLADARRETERSVSVAFFTNEEGARFAPDMMGSGVHQGALDLDAMLAVRGIDGVTVGDQLRAIGYAGNTPCGGVRASHYLELHIEQGPVLEQRDVTIGAVEGVQGISWSEFRVQGVSNHAGTTPMGARHDAGFVATELAGFVRRLALEFGGDQVATVGALQLEPNLINVIPERATFSVDLRNTDDTLLREAESRTFARAEELAVQEGVTLERRELARFTPVAFDADMIALVESQARTLGHSVRRMPSGAGHDAQMFAPHSKVAMIFVPSRGGISHNVEEYTSPSDLEAGANVLLQAALVCAS